MRVKTFILLSLFILFVSCDNKKYPKEETIIFEKPYPHIIDITEGFGNPAEIKLSSIADSIKYIILSKNKDVIIGAFPCLQMTESDFYIQYRSLIYRFDLSGKFLNTIGKIGRGPEEYLSGSSFTLSPSSEIIYVKRNYMHDYISYNTAGVFRDNVDLMKPDYVWEFNCLSDSVYFYTYIHLFMKDKSLEDFLLCGIFNKNGTKINVIEHPAKNAPPDINFLRLGVSPPSFTFYKNHVVLNYGDTIYKINQDSIFPGFILNWGNIPHLQTFEERYYIQTEPTNKVVPIWYFFEIQGKAYFNLKDQDQYYLIEYDKITGITRSMMSKGKESFGFIDDIDGGTNYFPKWTNKVGNIWIDYDDAFEFKNAHNKDFLSKSYSVYPDRKEDLREFLNSLKEDDNPVLKIVYLKNK